MKNTEAIRRTQALATIESTFPPDSEDQEKRETGSRLFGEAVIKAGVNWRSADIEILETLAQLCKKEAAQQR